MRHTAWCIRSEGDWICAGDCTFDAQSRAASERDLIQRMRDALAEVVETEPARRASPSIDCLCQPLIDEADRLLGAP